MRLQRAAFGPRNSDRGRSMVKTVLWAAAALALLSAPGALAAGDT
jgi:hypothetical protein